jgi:UDP-N-acetylglucosamine 2-epimerase (non-hydrolysing)
MKVAPLIGAFETAGCSVVLVHTGQHYDPSMSDVFFAELGIPRPDHHLEVGSASHAVQTARIMESFEPVLMAEQPDWVVVVGDVNSTVACALVAAKLGVRVAHVEAGLRSRDLSMPEEINRLVTDRLSTLLLAPSPDGVENLRTEGYPDGAIELVGNVMVDTLLSHVDRAASVDVPGLTGLAAGSAYGLLTLHRPSNVDDPRVFGVLMAALGRIAERLPLVWPVHPRVRARFSVDTPLPQRITLLEPVGYLASVALQRAARLVLTDSGGIQEETTVLGVRCFTLRDNTERPLTVTEGTNTIVGTDPARIVGAVEEELLNPAPARRPALWDGKAADRIVAAVLAQG